LMEQYLSGKWDIALSPSGTGTTEVEMALASDGYSAFTTNYLARLANSSNLLLSATNEIDINLMGSAFNITAPSAGITFNATNINIDYGLIQTNGGDINFQGAVNLTDEISIQSQGGNIEFNTTGVTLNYGSLYVDATSSPTTGGTISLVGGNIASSANVFNSLNLNAASFDFEGDIDLSASYYANLVITSQNSLTLGNITSDNSVFVTTTGPSADIIIPSGVTINAPDVQLNPTGTVVNNN
jgi:hypothetical protein